MAANTTKALSTKTLQGDILPEEHTFAARLRAAVFGGVGESDVEDVVKSITQKAKSGDPAATKLFFEYVLGHGTKPTSIVVHNHFADVEQGARVVKAAQEAERKPKRVG